MRVITTLAAGIISLALVQTPAADEPEQIEFDIFDSDGTMTVWADLSGLITSKRVSQLQEGIDLGVEYQLTLHRPRRLWGAEKKAQVVGAYRIGYRLITQDYFISSLSEETLPDRYFLTLRSLHQFLADSVTFGLASLESLSKSEQYFTRLKVTCIALTSLNVADGEKSDESGASAIRWLFKGFLELTNFGREGYEVESRPFSLSEITTRQ
jgi:hypothetical protein